MPITPPGSNLHRVSRRAKWVNVKNLRCEKLYVADVAFGSKGDVRFSRNRDRIADIGAEHFRSAPARQHPQEAHDVLSCASGAEMRGCELITLVAPNIGLLA